MFNINYYCFIISVYKTKLSEYKKLKVLSIFTYNYRP